MKRAVIVAATAAALIGGSTLVYQAHARSDGWGQDRHHFARMNPDDMSAFADARIAALKAGLRLTPEQEKHWPAVEAALKEMAAKRIERRQERRAQREERRAQREERRANRGERAERPERPNPVERLRTRADRLSEMGANLKNLADATEPLYQSLDEGQKRRFQALAQAGMRGVQPHAHRDGRGWRDHNFDRTERWRGGPGKRDRIEQNAPAESDSERL